MKAIYCKRCYDKNFLIECHCGCMRVRTFRGSDNRYRKYLKGHNRNHGSFKKGSENPKWNNGRTYTDHGYLMIRDDSHPRSHKGYVYQHILVMEKHIGRYLEKNELVHHVNGVKLDNRIENLKLMLRTDHSRFHLHLKQKVKS